MARPRGPRCSETIRCPPPGGEPRSCKKYAVDDLPVCHSHARIWANEHPLEFLAQRLGRVTGAAVAWVIRETFELEVTLAVERASGLPLVYSTEGIGQRSPVKRSALCRGIIVHLAMDAAQVAADAMDAAGDLQSASMIRVAVEKGRGMARCQAADMRRVFEEAGFHGPELDALLMGTDRRRPRLRPA